MNVTAHRLFHVSGGKPYNTLPPLSPGQSFTCGDSHNPFFGFYERPRTYPVNQNGSLVDVRAMSFLKGVNSGAIQCGILPQVALEVAQHYVMLSRELIMEDVRLRIDSGLPSRQSCLWGAEDIDQARLWVTKLGSQGAVSIFELEVTGSLHKADAALLLGDAEALSETIRKAEDYWRGVSSPQPEWESLFAGEAKVLRIVT